MSATIILKKYSSSKFEIIRALMYNQKFKFYMVSNEHSLNLERRQFTWIYSMHFILKKWLSLDTRWSRQHFSTGILIGDIEELYGHMHISTKKFISVKKKAFKNAERNLLKKHLKMLIGLNKRQMSKYRYVP